MNHLAPIQDVWSLATEDDKLKALALLKDLPARKLLEMPGDLPSQQTLSASLQDASLAIALEGVTRYGLSEAIKAILRGALGHPFFPAPPELRKLCDEAMRPHIEQRERIRRLEDQLAERKRFSAAHDDKTPAAKARVSKAYERYLASFGDVKASEEEKERAALRARYGMTPEVLASIQDNPKAREKMGVKA